MAGKREPVIPRHNPHQFMLITPPSKRYMPPGVTVNAAGTLVLFNRFGETQ